MARAAVVDAARGARTARASMGLRGAPMEWRERGTRDRRVREKRSKTP
jgi:hypothetical protein